MAVLHKGDLEIKLVTPSPATRSAEDGASHQKAVSCDTRSQAFIFFHTSAQVILDETQQDFGKSKPAPMSHARVAH